VLDFVLKDLKRVENILAADLARRLDVLTLGLFRIRDTPASSTTRARLLRQSESNAVDKSSSNKGTLSITGAACHTNALGVNANARRRLESIHDAVDAPCPGSRGTGAVTGAVQVEELALTTTAAARLLAYLIVVESNRSNIGRNWDTGCSIGDDGWKWPSTARLLNGNGKRDRFSSFSRGDGHRCSRVCGSDRRWLCREVTEFLCLNSCAYFLVPAIELCLGSHGCPIEELERIG
jgi:hypothetical protein